jgi:hypothetical protein
LCNYFIYKMNNKKSSKCHSKFVCHNCDYYTSRISQYERHLQTLKHINCINNDTKGSEIYKYICECGKEYKHRQNLHAHKKKCNNENKVIEVEEEKIDYKEMFFTLIKQNNELQQTITEMIPKIGNNNNNINQKFNINVFLNEQCKDALTMEEFINKIEVSLSNLMLTKNKGINEGISNIFIENMNKLSLYERPIHCTDVKRETIYVKSEGENGDLPKWEKDENNEKVKGAINKVTHLQHKNINKWTDNNPNWEDKSDLQDEYLQIIKKCTDDINENKVIKKLCDLASL